MRLASVKSYVETLLGTALFLFVIGYWADATPTILGDAALGLVGSVFVGSILYGLSMFYRSIGLRVGARGAIVYLAIMLVALLVRYVLFGAP